MDEPRPSRPRGTAVAGRPGPRPAATPPATGTASAPAARPTGAGSRTGLTRLAAVTAVVATIAVGIAVVVAATMDLPWSVRTWDTFTQRAVVERVDRLGGTYYTTGTEQKGPAWLAAYSVVGHLTDRSTFWLGLGVAVVVVAALTGLAVAGVVTGARPGQRHLATAAGLGTAAYLAIGPDEFSHVLHSRNLVALFFAAGLAGAVWVARHRWNQGAAAVTIASGALVGLGVQTMPASAGTAVVFLLLVIRLGRLGRPVAPGIVGVPVPALLWAAAVGATLVAVPGWYLLRGVFDDFWQQWWTYNRFYSEAGGLSLGAQIRRGAGDFAGYYRDHPLLAAGLVTFAVDTAARRRRLGEVERAVSLALPAWWLAECLSVATSQRFFPHYPVLTFVPTAAMIGLVATRWLDGVPRGVTVWAPLGALVLVVAVPGWGRFDAGMERAASLEDLDGLTGFTAEGLPPGAAGLRATVQALTGPDDYIYVWSKFPHYYVAAERTAASRYVENRWLTGEIFGAPGHHPDYVLPGTWGKWRDDMAETDPALIATKADEPVPPGSPLAELLAADYRPVCADRHFTYFVPASAPAPPRPPPSCG